MKCDETYVYKIVFEKKKNKIVGRFKLEINAFFEDFF